MDGGPLSIKIVVSGKTIGGFDLSASSYTIRVATGRSPTITKVIPADPAAHADDDNYVKLAWEMGGTSAP